MKYVSLLLLLLSACPLGADITQSQISELERAVNENDDEKVRQGLNDLGRPAVLPSEKKNTLLSLLDLSTASVEIKKSSKESKSKLDLALALGGGFVGLAALAYAGPLADINYTYNPVPLYPHENISKACMVFVGCAQRLCGQRTTGMRLVALGVSLAGFYQVYRVARTTNGSNNAVQKAETIHQLLKEAVDNLE